VQVFVYIPSSIPEGDKCLGQSSMSVETHPKPFILVPSISSLYGIQISVTRFSNEIRLRSKAFFDPCTQISQYGIQKSINIVVPQYMDGLEVRSTWNLKMVMNIRTIQLEMSQSLV
jgi:hypothetical protein